MTMNQNKKYKSKCDVSFADGELYRVYLFIIRNRTRSTNITWHKALKISQTSGSTNRVNSIAWDEHEQKNTQIQQTAVLEANAQYCYIIQ